MMLKEIFTSLYQQIENWFWPIVVSLGFGFVLLIRRLVRSFTGGFVKAASKYLEKLGQDTFQWFQRLLAFGFRAKYNKHLIHICRTYEIQGKTRGPFTPDLEKVFVPLRVAAASPQNASPNLLRDRVADETRSIWDVLVASYEQPHYRCIALIGAPGFGKTTLLRHLTLVHAQQRQYCCDPRARRQLPVLILLRDLQEKITLNPRLDLADSIQDQSNIRQLNPPPGWFKSKLRKGKCLVLLDGLDEVANADQRKAVGQWVTQQMLNYPNTCFIITSRPYGYRDVSLSQFGIVLDVQPFNLEQMEQFLDNWYLQNEVMRQVRREDAGVRTQAAIKAADLKARILTYPALAAMAVNPLLLTMIATVHDNQGALPGRRVKLYGDICEHLLGRRQEAKGLADILTPEKKQRVLQVLGLVLMEAKTRSFTLDEGSRYIRDRLARVAGPELTGQDFLKQVEDLSGLLVQQKVGVYEFAHKSFQEYLAAVEIKEANLTDYLLDKLTDSWWEETVRLYAVQTKDASGLLEAILSNPTVASLALAYECLEEGAEVQLATRQELQSRIDRGLESTDLETAKLAAQVKLAQRLKRLTPVDDKRSVDMAYITCAEYQLLIDDMRCQDRHRQPDHWPSNHFIPGAANQPVTGIRATDAVEFCQWLSRQSTEVGTRYRLPTLEEARQFELTRTNIGYWYEAEGKWYTYGIKTQQLEKLKTLFLRGFSSDWDRAHPLARPLALDLALDLALVHPRDLVRVYNLTFVHDLDLASTCHLARVHAHHLAQARAHARARTHRPPARDVDLDSGLTRAGDLAHARDLARACDLARDLVHEFAHEFDLELELSLFRERARTRDRNYSELVDARVLFCILVVVGKLLSEKKVGLNWFQRLIGKKTDASLEFEQSQRAVFDLYTFFVLIDERRRDNFSSGEGIRIVKERITEL